MSNEAVSIVLAQTDSDGADDGVAPAAAPDTGLTDVAPAAPVDEGVAPAAAPAKEGEGGDILKPADNEGGDDQQSPETYADFVMPEGVELNAELLGEATPIFKELNLTQEQAQKLIDFQASQVQASQTGQAEAFDQLKKDWQEQTKSDKDIGGDKFEQSVSDGREALTKFGTPELSKLLSDFGIGNHPEMIRFMAKVGALTKEDNPGGLGSPPSKKGDRSSILYPKSEPK